VRVFTRSRNRTSRAARRFLHLRDRDRQLRSELERLSELRRGVAGEFLEKERLETVAETTAFIRDTLKEAAPRVARNYVYHVSIEANQMFREIMGDATRSLKWAEDYSIVLEEDGYERPFISLSGGEQMAAALAVRLGLLKTVERYSHCVLRRADREHGPRTPRQSRSADQPDHQF
jgi:DNA repair exonuclease SbcCD ATPase subunit